MGDYFNPTQAQLTGDSPERTQVQSSTTSSSVSTSSSPTTTSAFTSSSTTTASGGGGGGSNVGAIAGGVAGGVVGLCIIAVLAFWLLRNRNKPPTYGENNDSAGVQSIRTSHQPLMRPEMATIDSSGQAVGQHTSMAPSVTSGGTTGQGLNSPTTPPGSGPWFPPPQNFAAQQQKYAPPIQNPDEAYLHAHAMAGPAWSGVPNV
ncbi:hypothetical protein DL93DRAFT_2088944 [Clavulina sp. PMI_390]|nr:hypothetical protein DL93DRAFT_2088944 [Clavulina sp. PMI_390]